MESMSSTDLNAPLGDRRCYTDSTRCYGTICCSQAGPDALLYLLDSITSPLTLGSMPPPEVPVWRVSIDGEPTPSALFDDLDTALAYLRGYLATNGETRAVVETARMNPLRYAAEVEAEDGQLEAAA